jgi:hypothetical protein
MVRREPIPIDVRMNRAFGAGGFWLIETLGRCPRLQMNDAPLALTNNQAKGPIPTGRRPIFLFEL